MAKKWDYAGGGDIGTQNQLRQSSGKRQTVSTAVDPRSKAERLFCRAGFLRIITPPTARRAVGQSIGAGGLGKNQGGLYKSFPLDISLDLGYCEAGEEVKVTNTRQ